MGKVLLQNFPPNGNVFAIGQVSSVLHCLHCGRFEIKIIPNIPFIMYSFCSILVVNVNKVLDSKYLLIYKIKIYNYNNNNIHHIVHK